MSQASAPTKQRTKEESVAEQAASMTATPQSQHHWLQKLVGEWTYEMLIPAQAGRPEMKAMGTERVRPIGGIWVQAEGDGEMPGSGPATTIMTLGYDPAKGRFVGSWIGSMMTHQWVYDGELDTAKNELTLTSEGPSMSGDGTLALYRDTIALKSDRERTLTASVRGEDGAWQPFMSVTYRRK
jgi:Protein of unknown function (DUF1579)